MHTMRGRIVGGSYFHQPRIMHASIETSLNTPAYGTSAWPDSHCLCGLGMPVGKAAAIRSDGTTGTLLTKM